jgi:hypothetical protein
MTPFLLLDMVPVNQMAELSLLSGTDSRRATASQISKYLDLFSVDLKYIKAINQGHKLLID